MARHGEWCIGVGVIDAGSADWLGKRATQEDTHVLTSFSAAPRDGGERLDAAHAPV